MNSEERLKHQRDLLANALRDIFVKLGWCNVDVEPNGAELLMLTENFLKQKDES